MPIKSYLLSRLAFFALRKQRQFTMTDNQNVRVVNEVLPSDPNQIKGMFEPGPSEPIFMVNLLKFKDKAEYEDGRPCELTGHEAYQLYGEKVAKIIPKFGGQLVFAANVTFLSLGQADPLWDEVAIAAYPTRGALKDMSMSKEWQEAAVHRTAGLAGQLNIETTLMDSPFLPDWLTRIASDLSAGQSQE